MRLNYEEIQQLQGLGPAQLKLVSALIAVVAEQMPDQPQAR